MRFVPWLGVALVSTARTSAQAINIDVYDLHGTPSSQYGAAAGQAGVWNSVPPTPNLNAAGAGV